MRGESMSASLKPARIRSKTSGYWSGVRPASVRVASAGATGSVPVTGFCSMALRSSTGVTSTDFETTGAVARGALAGVVTGAGPVAEDASGAGTMTVATGAVATGGVVSLGAEAQPERAATRTSDALTMSRARFPVHSTVKSHPQGQESRYRFRNMTVLRR